MAGCTNGAVGTMIGTIGNLKDAGSRIGLLATKSANTWFYAYSGTWRLETGLHSYSSRLLSYRSGKAASARVWKRDWYLLVSVLAGPPP